MRHNAINGAIIGIGMFVAASLYTNVGCQRACAQGRRGGGIAIIRAPGVNPLGLIANAAVQKDLGVGEDKAEKLQDIAEDIRQEIEQERQGAGIDPGSLRDLSGEEREKKTVEIRKKLAEIQKTVGDKFSPKVAEILDKTQMVRLQQIAIQAAGASALEDACVAKDLKLSKEQQDTIAAID